MRFTIISCSTRGCVSPVRFMVPSSRTTAWTVGKLVLCNGSERTDSMVGMLKVRGIWELWGPAHNLDLSPLHPGLAPGYLLMRVPHCSAWLRSWGLLRLARVSPSFRSECSMAVQEADREKDTRKHDGNRGGAEAGPRPRGQPALGHKAKQGGKSGLMRGT